MARKNNHDLNIKRFKGDLAVDDRGALQFVNDFSFENVKRFYQVENYDVNVIRAFHGHKKEGKYVYVPAGAAIVCAVAINDFDNPERFVKVERFILSDKKPEIVFIPPMYANGFKTLEKNTKIIFFSTSTLEESKGDDFRFPFDYWGEHIWKTENR